MARRKQAAAEAVELTPEALTPPPPSENVPPQSPENQQPGTPQQEAEQPQRQWRVNPFPIKTVNLGGYKVQLQESRPEHRPNEKYESWEMQIKFGSGSKDDMPPEIVLDYIKSHKLDVETKDGRKTQVQLFNWNDKDRAWGMEIPFAKAEDGKAPDYSKANASRAKAAEVFSEAVKLVAHERGVGRQR